MEVFHCEFVKERTQNNVMPRRSNTGIPGLSFSLKRALGITQAKQKIARATGVPTTKAGIERKIGQTVINLIFGKRR